MSVVEMKNYLEHKKRNENPFSILDDWELQYIFDCNHQGLDSLTMAESILFIDIMRRAKGVESIEITVNDTD